MEAPPLPELPLAPDDQNVLSLLDATPPSRARHCFRSAIDHLRRAHLIKDIDPAMAVFRGITAEEEAASGLMHALISMDYPQSNLLKPRNHVQKHAVTPFLLALLRHLSDIKLNGVQSVRLAITNDREPSRLVVVFVLEGEGDPCTVRPIPPLNLSVNEGNEGFPNLTKKIGELLAATGHAKVHAFLQSEANLRNRILYAGPDGCPVVHDLQPGYLVDRQRRVLTILKTALLILPYAEIQPFVSDALAAFLRLIDKLPEGTADEA